MRSERRMGGISPSSSFGFLFCVCFVVSLLVCSPNKAYAAAAAEGLPESDHLHTIQIASLLPPPHHTCNSSPQDEREEGSVLRVVHSHGPCSPLRSNGQDKSKRTSPTIADILTQDQYRVNSIKRRLSLKGTQSQADLPAKLGVPLGTYNYVVKVGLGNPRKDLSLVFDTGSVLTWTQCEPCVGFCYKQQDLIFDPSSSKSYRNISCSSSICSKLVSATSTSPGCSSSTCVYGIRYADQSFSIGYFATETLTLTTTDTFPTFLFGCGQNNRGLFGKTAGVLGLGRDTLSLVSQTASKYGKYFSYCLPSTTSTTGHLIFGKSSTRATRNSVLKFTPLLTKLEGPQFYFIDITGIKVGEQKLSIQQSIFKTAGAIIDSGTVITQLPPTAYVAMRTAFRKQMMRYPLTQAQLPLDTCYDLSNYSMVYIPKMSFFFEGINGNGEIEVALDLSGVLFGKTVSQVCLAFVANSDDSDVVIFGNVQQRTLEVAYDVVGGKLGFGTAACS